MNFCDFFLQDGGSLDQVLKEARRIPEEILGKVSIAVSICDVMVLTFIYRITPFSQEDLTCLLFLVVVFFFVCFV